MALGRENRKGRFDDALLLVGKVLAAAERVDPALACAVRQVLTRDDDYASLGKPPCDWDDPKAREARWWMHWCATPRPRWMAASGGVVGPCW